MKSEIQRHADFGGIRYAQCWEDADVLTQALDVKPGQTCVSIASAGDNSLALLAFAPARVYAVDLSAAQLACVALRVAAYKALSHGELLELIGSRPSRRRAELYQRCRSLLASRDREFWDASARAIEAGIGSAGKFEHYFRLFRSYALPLVHGRAKVRELLRPKSREERERFYDARWDNRRWRALFRFFFSRPLMGALGRDPSFFRYVEGSVGERILTRTRHALTVLDPAANPYVHWILTGTHGEQLPFALRTENFERIRDNLDRLELRAQPLEAFLAELGARSVDRYNLSDIFEYMSEASYESLLRRLVEAARPQARLAYWNMLAPRRRPDSLADQLQPRRDISEPLFQRDQAFFYSDFVVEDVA